jgi:ankyrin repeat protein
VLSLLVASTMGCVLVAFLEILVLDRFVVGLAYPFATAALMRVIHLLQRRFAPREHDPHHQTIQISVIVGGLLSVGLAYSLSPPLSVLDLALGGVALGFLGLLSIALEQFWVAREHRAARAARAEAERARRLGEDGDLASADEMLQEALLTTEIAFGSHHPQVATIVTYLAEVMQGVGNQEACGLLLKRAVDVHSALPESQELIHALTAYTEHLRRQGQLREALNHATRAVMVSHRLHQDEVPTAHCLLALARLQAGLDQHEQAHKSSQAAAAILEKKLGRNHRDTIKARATIANHCVAMGRAAEGQRILSDLISLRDRVEGDTDDVTDLDVLLDMARAQRLTEPEQSKETYGKALSVFRAKVGPGYERARELLEPLPDYLSLGGAPGLDQLYHLMVAGDAYNARQFLRDHKELAQVVDVSGWTPLQWACFFGLTEVVSMLISLECDLEHGREVDYPALYVAARWGRHRSVSDLLQKADINTVCVDGSRPLHGAVRSGDQLTFDILVSRKAQLDVVNVRGWTALHEAAYLGHRKFVVGLISEGLDPNFQAGPSFDTPLHAAVRGNSWLTTETLLLNNARLELMNSEDETPLELAQELWHDRVIAVLEQARSSKIKVAVS